MNSQKAISPVLAVVLVVAITVVLATIVGTIALDISSNSGDAETNDASVTLTQTESNVVAQLVTGKASKIVVKQENTVIATESNVQAGDPVQIPKSKIKPDSTLIIISETESGTETVIESISLSSEEINANAELTGTVTVTNND